MLKTRVTSRAVSAIRRNERREIVMKKLFIVAFALLVLSGCSNLAYESSSPTPTSTENPSLTERQIEKGIETTTGIYTNILGAGKDDMIIRTDLYELEHVYTADIQLRLRNKRVGFIIDDFDIEYKGSQSYLIADSIGRCDRFVLKVSDFAIDNFMGKTNEPNELYYISVDVDSIEPIKYCISSNEDDTVEIYSDIHSFEYVIKGTCNWIHDLYFFGTTN
jgi:hypothetical protein